MPDPQGLKVASRSDAPPGGRAPARGERAALCELASRLLLREVDEAALELLRRSEVREVFEKLEPGCGDYVTRSWAQRELDEAAETYTALFLMPRGASPCASAWLDTGAANVGSALEVWSKRALAALGLALDESTSRHPPGDHLGVLLAVLAACLRDDAPVARELEAQLVEHLRSWVPTWAASVRESTNNPLYRAIPDLALAALSFDET